MKRSLFLATVLLFGMVLFQTGCAVEDDYPYRSYDYDWYPYGTYYWWPYEAYPDRDYRFRYVPRHREHHEDHFIGRPRYGRPHERGERYEGGERHEREERGERGERGERHGR